MPVAGPSCPSRCPPVTSATSSPASSPSRWVSRSVAWYSPANENNVLDEFFRSGVYRPRSAAQTLATSSPSMDISKASNLERFIFELVGRDPARVVGAWDDLEAQGTSTSRPIRSAFLEEFGIVSGTSTHADRLATIRSVYETTGEVIDPHTGRRRQGSRASMSNRVFRCSCSRRPSRRSSPRRSTRPSVSSSAMRPSSRRCSTLPQHVTEMGDDEHALRASSRRTRCTDLRGGRRDPHFTSRPPRAAVGRRGFRCFRGSPRELSRA